LMDEGLFKTLQGLFRPYWEELEKAFTEALTEDERLEKKIRAFERSELKKEDLEEYEKLRKMELQADKEGLEIVMKMVYFPEMKLSKRLDMGKFFTAIVDDFVRVGSKVISRIGGREFTLSLPESVKRPTSLEEIQPWMNVVMNAVGYVVWLSNLNKQSKYVCDMVGIEYEGLTLEKVVSGSMSVVAAFIALVFHFKGLKAAEEATELVTAYQTFSKTIDEHIEKQTERIWRKISHYSPEEIEKIILDLKKYADLRMYGR